MQRKVTVLALVMAFFWSGVFYPLVPQAEAHPWQNRFVYRWLGGSPVGTSHPEWVYVHGDWATIPEGDVVEQRTKNGFARWNNIAVNNNLRVRFIWGGTRGFARDCEDRSYNANLVYKGAISEDGVLGETRRCRTVHCWNNFVCEWRAHNFDVRIDPGYNWYLGTGQPASNQYDLWSLMTHELGHGVGWKHWGMNTALCTDLNNYHTMCEDIPIGTTTVRTPKPHDRHTFIDAYTWST